jgi:hypothetical protein
MAASTEPNSRFNPSTLLWASAFVLAGLIVVQLGRINDRRGVALAELPAGLMGADGVSRVGDYTVMTFNAGNDDVLAVLDGRGEELFTYRVKNLNQFEFLGREKLPEMFTTGRKLGPGRK